MYTLSAELTFQVVGGACPICLATAAGAALGASGMTLAITSQQFILLGIGAFILTGSMLYALYHSKDEGIN